MTKKRHTTDLDIPLSKWVEKQALKTRRSISAQIAYLCEEQRAIIVWNEKAMADKK